MKLSKEKQGEGIIVLEALIWSLFPVITIFLYSWFNPLITLLLSNFFAAVFFAVIISAKRKWKDVTNRVALKNIFWVTLFLLTLWIFFFNGLKHTTAGNASIFMLLEILYSFLYFGLRHKESFSKSHIWGAVIMSMGAIVILFPGEINLNKGDLLIIIGGMFAPIANYFQQKARKQVGAETILFVRNVMSLPIIAIMAHLFGQLDVGLAEFKQALPLLILNGVLIFGFSKILWIEGIHRISVAKAASLNTIAPAFTLFFAYLFLNEIPTTPQMLGFIPMLIGGILITQQ